MIPGLILVAFAVLAAYELWPLWQAKRWRQLAAAGTIWLVALAYSLLQASGVPTPDMQAPVRGFFDGGGTR